MKFVTNIKTIVMQTLQIILPESVKNDLEIIKKRLNDLNKNFTPKDPDTYLTRNEACELLKISLPTLHQWSKSGILEPMKMGTRTYFSRKKIEEALKESNKK